MHVLEIWRYPVSSVGGEQLRSARVSPQGLDGDRCFALVDSASGQPAAPEKVAKWRKALSLSSRIGESGRPDLIFPDGRAFRVDDTALPAVLTAFFEFPVMLCKYAKPAWSALDMPTVENRYVPAALHVVTQTSIDRLSERLDTAVTARRFRPSVLLSGEGDAYAENNWVGHDLEIGALTCHVTDPTKRCGMTFIPQPGLDENPDILRTIVRENRRNFGAYCSVARTAVIAVGNPAAVWPAC